MKILSLFVLTLSVSTYSIVVQAESSSRTETINATSTATFDAPSTGTKIWSYSVGDTVYGSPVIDENNNVYFASRNATIYALNPNGSLRWQTTVSQGITHSLSYQNGSIYYRTYGGSPLRDGSNPEEFGTLNATTGQPLWSHAFGEWGRGSIAVTADGTSYIVDWDLLKKFSPEGVELGSFLLAPRTATTPVIGADGSVYAYSPDGLLRAFSPDLDLLWTRPLSPSVSPLEMAIGKNGTIYVPTNNGVVYAVSSNGQLLWQRYVGFIGQSEKHGVVIDRNDNLIMTVFTGTENQDYIQAISPQGNLLWSSLPFGSWHIATIPTIADNGNILVGAAGSGIYALSETGAFLWSSSFYGGNASSVAIANNGISYLATNQAINAYATNGLKIANTAWPQQHANLSGTSRAKTIVGHPPELTIDSPLNGSNFQIADGAISLQATASDFEDGDISHLVKWTSDLDGALGSLANLSVGLHTITATITDSDDESASTFVQVEITDTHDEEDEEESETSINQAPTLVITIKQHGREVGAALVENGAVHVTVVITDPNPEDSHNSKWFLNGVHLVEFDNLLELVIPSVDVAAGVYEIKLEVSDNGEPIKTQVETRIIVVDGEPNIQIGAANPSVIAFMLLLFLRRRRLLTN